MIEQVNLQVLLVEKHSQNKKTKKKSRPTNRTSRDFAILKSQSTIKINPRFTSKKIIQ